MVQFKLDKVRRSVQNRDLVEKSKSLLQKDALGPGEYTIKEPINSPVFSFGSRFNSDIRSKEHLKPKKVDGPGPGDYLLHSAIRVQKRALSSTQDCTFGKAGREWSDLPRENPSPTQYNPPILGVDFNQLQVHMRPGFAFK